MWIVGLALLAWFLWHVDWRQMGASLAKVHAGIFLLAILGNLITPILRAGRFGTVFDQSGRTKEMSCLMGQFGLLNQLMPARSGEVAFLAMLKRRGVIAGITKALPRWIFIRVCDLTAVLSLVACAAMISPALDDFGAWFGFVRVVLLGSLIGILLLVFALQMFPPGPDLTTEAGYLRRRLRMLHQGLSGLHHWRTLSLALFWSAIIWIWATAMLTVVYSSFDTSLSLQTLWIAAVLVMGVSILPVHAPLAIGTLHVAQVAVLKALGAPTDIALAMAVGGHAATVITVVSQGSLGTFLLARFRAGGGATTAGQVCDESDFVAPSSESPGCQENPAA